MTGEKPTYSKSLSKLVQPIAESAGYQRCLSASGNQAFSLRRYLVLLVAGTLLPVVIFAVAVVYKLSNQEQAAAERRILLAARNLASMVDHELSSTARTLQALASSEQLSRGNLQGFYDEASRVSQTQTTWMTVILLSPQGQQLVNTIQPFGERLPTTRELESFQRVVRTRQPTVGNLSRSVPKSDLIGIPLRIPVMRDGDLQYILTAIIDQKAIARVVNGQATIDQEWTRTVVDGQGIVVARTRRPEQFVGKRGTPSFLKRIGESSEGVYRDTTLEGMKVYVAFCRVKNSPWTVAVTVPVDVVQGPARQAIWLVVGSGLALLLVSGLGAFLLSRQLSRSITSAALAAEALARGEYPQVSPLSIQEVALLGQSLEFAANLLLQREQERNENLRQAESARADAEAANRIKDEFLAVLSHELRTPLNPILGWARLLRNGKLDATKTAFALETIERNAKLQTQLIEDLLDVSRIMRGKLSLNTLPVNLVSVIESAIETVRLAAEAKAIALKFVALQSVQVMGDAARLQQVFWNLLTNAVKFTDEGGRVEIRLQESQPVSTMEDGNGDAFSPNFHLATYAQITISDTGKGIDPAFLPHVFEYFLQEDGKTTRKFGGLGLGLAIVKHLVELHGGTVQASSLGEGQGATFTVELPILKNEDSGLKPGSSTGSSLAPAGSMLKDLRVLLVDDDPDTRELIAFTLRQNQAITTSVSSASEALEVFAQLQFDLVISDIGMPEMDGYMLIQQIRSRSSQEGGQVPAIALTAYAGEHNQQQALRSGFQRHIAKPLEPETLLKVILDLINTHRKTV